MVDLSKPQHAAPAQPAVQTPVRAFLVRLPEDLYERLRERHYRDHRPMAEVVRDALSLYLR